MTRKSENSGRTSSPGVARGGAELRGAPGPVRAAVHELIDVCGYSRSQIRINTRHGKPGTPLLIRPEADVAVFQDSLHHERNVLILLDCSSRDREKARAILEGWLGAVPSLQLAGWRTEEDSLYFRRQDEEVREVSWREIPRPPTAVERSGPTPIRRSDLVPPKTLIRDFAKIRDFLAANATGITRDAAIAEQMALVILCKVFDEINSRPTDPIRFWTDPNHPPEATSRRVKQLLEEVKSAFPATLLAEDEIRLDDSSLCHIVAILQKYELTGAQRDILGEAFEAFIGPTLRGEEGQFFTPRNVARLAIAMLSPKPGEELIDPACGSGGFLSVMLERLATASGPPAVGRGVLRTHDEGKSMVGIDKDRFLAKIARLHLAILGANELQVLCENSLGPPETWSSAAQRRVRLGTFDAVATNPPFGAKIPVRGERLLAQYDLGFEWVTRREEDSVDYTRTDVLKEDEAPQILFVERCLHLLKEGGRMAIVVPDGILGNASLGYMRKLIRLKAEVVAVVDCPLETFMPHTSTKASVLVLRKCKNPQQGPVFMAIATKCGHDRRGNPLVRKDGTPDDDFPRIVQAFEKFRRKHGLSF